MAEKDTGSGRVVDRRSLLKLVGAGAAVSTLPREAHPVEPMAGMNMPEPHAAAPCSAQPAAYAFFNVEEAAFIEAAIDTLIPSDEVGPGALELGVAHFIDRQMSSGYGRGDRLYLQGPFMEGTPEQGYQMRMTPSELMQAGIADVNAHVQEQRRTNFAALSPPDRAAILTALETRAVALPNVPTETFFNLLYQLTQQGYFSDPIHGGNKDKGSWKMIGFPGIGGMYADKIEAFRNKRYVSDPIGIQDLT